MKKKNLFFMAVLAICACVSVCSCSNEDDDLAPNSGSSFNLAKGDLSGIWIPENWSEQEDGYNNRPYLFGSERCFTIWGLGKGINKDYDRDVHAYDNWYMDSWDEKYRYFVRDNNVYFKDGDYVSDVQFRIENGKLIKQEYGYDGLQDGKTYIRVDDSSKNSKLAGTRWKGKDGTGQVAVEVKCLDKHICEVIAFGTTNPYFYSYDEKTGKFIARHPALHSAKGTVNGKKMTGTFGEYTFTLTRQ